MLALLLSHDVDDTVIREKLGITVLRDEEISVIPEQRAHQGGGPQDKVRDNINLLKMKTQFLVRYFGT